MARTRVKVCGITNLDDALLAARMGADAVGFVFHPGSPRNIERARLPEIMHVLPPFVTCVGVFVGKSPAEAAAVGGEAGLDYLQLHSPSPGEIPPGWTGRIIPVFSVKNGKVVDEIREVGAPVFVMDSFVSGKPGGTGEAFPWRFAREAGHFGKVILAGGLNPGNVAQAIAEAEPYAVDVSSGVETRPGRKDPVLIEQFFDAVTRAARAVPSRGF